MPTSNTGNPAVASTNELPDGFLEALQQEGAPVIGIDLGGTKIAAGLLSPSGSVALTEKRDTPAQQGGAAVAQAVVAAVQSVRQRYLQAVQSTIDSALPPIAVGIGSAGVVDAAGRGIISATDAIPGWAGTRLADLVEEETALPTTICNDVHAHAMGESWLGAGRDYQSILMVACGTGVGGAFVSKEINGQVMRGAQGLAGHFGHIIVNAQTERVCSCGKVATHLEAFTSGPGLYQWYLERGGSSEVANARELEERALAYLAQPDAGGDALAAQVYHDSGEVLGGALAGLVNGLDPQAVIVGGGLANAGDLWWGPLRRSYQAGLMELVEKVPLIKPSLGSNSAIIGAGRLALLMANNQ